MRIAIALLLSLAACKGRATDGAPSQSSSPDKPSARTTRTSEPKPTTCDAAKDTLCVVDAVAACNKDGSVGRLIEQCKGRCRAGACVDTCAIKGNELIYLVDTDHNFLSFDPEKIGGDPFRLIGKLECETAGQPFSMGVASDGIAWVLYNTGRVYRVSILDAHCTKAGDPEEGPETFGMGFVATGPTAEKLYLAASDSSDLLGYLDTSGKEPTWAPIAKIAMGQEHHPELTGTGDGKLYGYFPEPTVGGFVTELDPTTGAAVGKRLPLGVKLTEMEAYAFAHWGGVFYVFTTAEHTNRVHAIHRATGKVELVGPRTPFEVVGAGVSTCAPELERAP